MSKKEILARALFRTGTLQLLRHTLPKRLIVLCYHRIRSDVPCEYLFDEGVLGPSQSEFERQIKWLKSNFDVLSESEILEQVSKPRLSKRSVAITFDDGYRDNYELAYPVLRAYGMPAIFFLCPALIDNATLGWWDLIPYFIKQSAKSAILVGGEKFDVSGSGRKTIEVLQGWMKTRPAEETASLVEDLSKACEVPFPDQIVQREEFMTWDEAREVVRNGISIGSHTHTHRVLGRLDEQAQRWEMTESKRALEEHLGGEVRTIAYPVGRYGNFTSTTMRIARECGYKGAFSFRTGENAPARIDAYDIRRISAGERLDAIFACGAYMPRAFTWT